MHDSPQGRIFRDALEQAFPGLPPYRVHVGTGDSEAVGRWLSSRELLPGDDDGLVPLGKQRCEPRCHALAVGRQDPGARRLDHGVGSLRHDEGPRCRWTVAPEPSRHYNGLPKARVRQESSPRLLIRRPGVGAVPVREPPPLRKQSHDEVRPSLPAQAVQSDQVTRRGEKISAMPQRLARVPDGGQRMGCDDEVESMGIETLLDGLGLDVQLPELDLGIQPLGTPLRFVEQDCRSIRGNICEPLPIQRRRNGPSRPSGARADFEHPQAALARKVSRENSNGVLDQPVRRARRERIAP